MQDTTCPLYKKWEKSKKSAHDVKIPLRLDAQEYESDIFTGESFNVDNAVLRVQDQLKEDLSDKHYKIYQMLFIENKTEDYQICVLISRSLSDPDLHAFHFREFESLLWRELTLR